jgi:hypothetical protein
VKSQAKLEIKEAGGKEIPCFVSSAYRLIP